MGKAPKLTKAQLTFLGRANRFGVITAGWGQGAAGTSCLRAGLVTRALNLDTGRREYCITDAGRAAIQERGG